MDLFRDIDNPTPNRVLAWFSCGAASAVAASLILAEHPAAQVVRIVVGTELKDSNRFADDVAKWLKRKVIELRSDKYPEGHLAVIRGERFMKGPHGAKCTSVLKRQVREEYQRPGDLHVFGFTVEEESRVADFRENNPGLWLSTPLIEAGLTKSDCHRIIERAGIVPHKMYRMGYSNANCVGCVKGGMGYWNKIRIDFPLMFDEMSRIEREIGHSVCRKEIDGVKVPVYLDELDPKAGRFKEDEPGDCGPLCQVALEKVGLA